MKKGFSVLSSFRPSPLLSHFALSHHQLTHILPQCLLFLLFAPASLPYSSSCISSLSLLSIDTFAPHQILPSSSFNIQSQSMLFLEDFFSKSFSCPYFLHRLPCMSLLSASLQHNSPPLPSPPNTSLTTLWPTSITFAFPSTNITPLCLVFSALHVSALSSQVWPTHYTHVTNPVSIDRLGYRLVRHIGMKISKENVY